MAKVFYPPREAMQKLRHGDSFLLAGLQFIKARVNTPSGEANKRLGRVVFAVAILSIT